MLRYLIIRWILVLSFSPIFYKRKLTLSFSQYIGIVADRIKYFPGSLNWNIFDELCQNISRAAIFIVSWQIATIWRSQEFSLIADTTNNLLNYRLTQSCSVILIKMFIFRKLPIYNFINLRHSYITTISKHVTGGLFNPKQRLKSLQTGPKKRKEGNACSPPSFIPNVRPVS